MDVPASPARDPAGARAPSLRDRYDLESGRVFLTGVQALVRLPFEQARRDRAAGLRTGTFVTGYPGSPLGGFDLALAQALREAPAPHGFVHRPAENEEMAATALMGTQMLERYPHASWDGVVGFWYGKGPGLDRAGDAVRHGNYAGTTRHGAVVVLSGEDHEAKSSTMPFGQEHYFVHAGMPILHPASVAEFLELGLHAVAMSRYAGLWVAMKLVGQLCDGGETVAVDPSRPAIAAPDFRVGGRPFEKRQYHRFFPGETVETERILHAERLPAAVAYARANRLDQIAVATERDRLAIVSAGKSFGDVRQALLDLGLDDAALRDAGIRLVKLGLIHPLDRAFVQGAVRGVEEVVVVEEKRGFLEDAIKAALYPLADRPRVVGKQDERGAPLFPESGGMDADLVAERLGPRLAPRAGPLAPRVARRLEELRAIRAREAPGLLRRTPNYCSGCPHNVSTRLNPGQVAWSAPGCHVFATLIEQPERHADATFQLGGEGLAWIGLAPFTDLPHVVQNQGDGALFHSSYLNIRFAVAAGVRITFRVLYNGAVANTGAQKPVGQRDVPTLARLLSLEGVHKIAIVAREPRDYRGVHLPSEARVHRREELPRVLADLAATDGVTVLLYDGECANERRRQQKRGGRAAPSRFVLVNEEVCENCGHCGAVTNCMSLHKVETELGEKTQVHQSSCNQDHLCLEGDCPSFVTVDVRDGARRRPPPPRLDPVAIPEPTPPVLDRPFHVVMPGVGGTGVLTVNSILAWASLLDGKGALSYDQTGAAQKWGAVLSSLVLFDPAARSRRPAASKVGLGQADLYLALDPMAAADPANLSRCAPARTASVVSTTLLPSGEMIRDVRLDPGLDRMVAAIARVSREGGVVKAPARALAEALFGDHLAANLLALGAAYQAGLLPLSSRAIEDAIRLNGTAVEQNLSAFRHGRLWVHAPERLAPLVHPARPSHAEVVEREGARLGKDRAAYAALLDRCRALDDESRRLLAVRVAGLVRFQDVRTASRYVDAVLEVARRERAAVGAEPLVTRAFVRGLHKLLAYKDEYEVARLHLEAGMQARAAAAFTGDVRIHYHLYPPLLRALGLSRKLRLGRWIEPALRLLAGMRRLRGTPLDPFGRTEVRRVERGLAAWYEGVVARALDRLAPDTHARVAEVAALPDDIRGYERLKLEGAARATARAEALLRDLGAQARPLSAAS
ncbi:MAG TPA: indolepyruvate ferredoxin oxidoreductase family protein [Anaeromyxobacter sp.]|nr:indolepyruvate ferredoxin oxidoreductase family protein [Anaeromyxobacter sp.]